MAIFKGTAAAQAFKGTIPEFDTVTYAAAPGGVVVLLQATDEFGIDGAYKNTPAGGKTGFARGDTYESIEGLTATADDDLIYGAAAATVNGVAVPSEIRLGAGNDKFDTTEGAGIVDKVFGESGNDLMFGGGGNDILDGGSENDNLFGEGGADQLKGGTGSDWAHYSTGTSDVGVTVMLSKVDVEGFSNGLTGIVDTSFNGLTGGKGGDAEGDTFDSIENVTGSEKDDLIYGLNGVKDSKGSYKLLGGDDIFDTDRGQNLANDTVRGGDGNDSIRSGGGNDILWGDNNDDFLSGEIGKDILIGGIGKDTLRGDTGNTNIREVFDDIFRYGQDTISSNFASSIDVILDFNKGGEKDKIDLKGIDANELVSGNQAFTFIKTAALSGAGQVRFEKQGLDTIVQVSTDADATPELAIRLEGFVTEMKPGDFVL